VVIAGDAHVSFPALKFVVLLKGPGSGGSGCGFGVYRGGRKPVEAGGNPPPSRHGMASGQVPGSSFQPGPGPQPTRELRCHVQQRISRRVPARQAHEAAVLPHRARAGPARLPHPDPHAQRRRSGSRRTRTCTSLRNQSRSSTSTSPNTAGNPRLRPAE